MSDAKTGRIYEAIKEKMGREPQRNAADDWDNSTPLQPADKNNTEQEDR